MAYKKANRHVTDEQFSENTTIDGSRIDKALEDIIVHQNDIPKGDFEAQWMPQIITMNWCPARPRWRWFQNRVNVKTRNGVNQSYTTQHNWFPFLKSRNSPSEVFPASEQPAQGIQNEYRLKSYYVNPYSDANESNYSRTSRFNSVDNQFDSNENNYGYVNTGTGASLFTTRADGIAAGVSPNLGRTGSGLSPLNHSYFSCTFPFYFNKPVIIMDVSVLAAQENPASYYNHGIVAGPAWYEVQANGYRNNIIQAARDTSIAFQDPDLGVTSAVPPAGGGIGTHLEQNTEDVLTAEGTSILPAACGQEFPGEYYTTNQQNIGNGTIQISIDNEFMSEQRNLNNVVFNKSNLGNCSERFNMFYPSTSEAGFVRPELGDQIQNMLPRWRGGSLWGVWIKEEDLNIPVPRDSRVRFSITNKGFRSNQVFEWHIALTILEMVEK